MCAAVSLREFIVERLTAAAADIFSACEQNIVRYEKEIDRQRRLLEISLKPRITESSSSSSTDILQLDECKEESCSTVERQEEPEPHARVKEDSKFLQRAANLDLSDTAQSELVKVEEDKENVAPQLVGLKQETDPTSICKTQDQREAKVESKDLPILISNVRGSQNPSQITPADSAATVSPRRNTRACRGNAGQKSRKTNFSSSEIKRNKGLKCEKCGKDVVKVYPHQQLKEIHTRENLCCCETCEKGLRKKKDFSGRPVRNVDNRSHVCEICSKGFATKNNVTVHMRFHTGEKPYICDICGKGFILPNLLKRHKVTHTGLRPFSCETCGRAFDVYRCLLVHMKTHLL